MSLRHILIFPFLLQIAVAIGLTGYFSWRNGQKTVESLAMRLSQEITAHIEKHVHNYTNTSSMFLKINEAAIRTGKLDLTNYQTMAGYFWEQIQLSDAVPYVYFGNPQGDFVGVWRENDNLTTLRIRTKSTAPLREIHKLDSQGKPIDLISMGEFDPRSRPWYQTAVKSGQLTWSDIYVFAVPPYLGITNVIPIYDSSQSLVGVMAVDLTLADISHFLRQLEISKSGQVFIIERSGEIVASSAPENPFLQTDTGEKRLAAVESSNSLIREAAQNLLTQFGSLSEIEKSQRLIFKIEGKRQFLQVVPIETQSGIDWLMVVVIPEADFMEYIQANTYTTILLCFIALMLAAVLGIATSQWIAWPILSLAKASQSLAKQAVAVKFVDSELVQELKNQSIRELKMLACAFNHMAQELEHSFNNLAKTNTELEQRVAERTRELKEANQELKRFVNIDGLTQVANRRRFDEYFQHTWKQLLREQQPLSLILCDVDCFKFYNDTYGHQAGDDALKQIAQVMVSVVKRPSDLVTRYGGEEFTIILPQTNLEGAIQVAEKIRQQVKQLQISHDTSTVTNVVTLSLGVSCCVPSQKLSTEILINKADRALYQSKAQGRDRVTGINLSGSSQ